jgi:26S proteasome regulatory subunit N9
MDFVQIPEESHIIIKNLQSKYPQYKDILSEIDGNISQSLWHQLSDNLIVLSNKPELQNSQDLIELYHGLVLYISEIVNPMKFLKYVQNMLVNYKNKMNEGLQFIENTENKMKFKGEEEIFLRIIKGFSYLELDKMYDLEDLITDIKNEFESKSEIDSMVYANFYRLSTYFYEKKNNYDEFYNNAFQFLAYEKNLSDEEKLNLCFKMCVASLIGEKMFNFAELIEKDFFKLMKGSKYEWLYNLILSFNSSNVDQFLNMLENYKNEIDSNKILNEKKIF